MAAENRFSITRKVELDAGHRVPLHDSKCKNIHGHRYVVEATVGSHHLVGKGSETGMIMDYGFLKQLMVEYIHDVYDHALILAVQDTTLLDVLLPHGHDFRKIPTDLNPPFVTYDRVGSKLVIVPEVPTAENLAKQWYDILKPPVMKKLNWAAGARLDRVRVFETPNCWADYPTVIPQPYEQNKWA